MTIMDAGGLPDWDAYYRENEVQAMPWFSAELDPDVSGALEGLGVSEGDLLDLGSGPGTQAVELARMGFNVTGSDVSEAAMRKAAGLGDASFVVDDILDTGLPEDGFDLVLDRGCFHVFGPDRHAGYLNGVKKILRQDGILLLKCMSKKETSLPEDRGPYRYDEEEIRRIFSGYFDIQDARDTVYYCTVDPLPRALFFVMRKR